jgi:hypothetical protein
MAYPGHVLAGLSFGALVTVIGLPLVDQFLEPLAQRALELRIVGRCAA